MSKKLLIKQMSVIGSSFSTKILHPKIFVKSVREATRISQKFIKISISDTKTKTGNNREAPSEEEINEVKTNKVFESDLKSGTNEIGSKKSENSAPENVWDDLGSTNERSNHNGNGAGGPHKGPNNTNGGDGKINKDAVKEIGLFALKTAVISGAVIGGTTLIVSALGFGASGVVSGSLAAAYQSSVLGGTIAPGSVFATLQSIGASGLSAAAKTGVVAGSATTAGSHSIWKIHKKKNKNRKSG